MAGAGCPAIPEMPCMWFSQPVTIPGEPTLKLEHRTFNVHVENGPHDWSKNMPWRAPGTAPVLGSGCGVAAGNAVQIANGGEAPPGYAPGTDALVLPENEPTIWTKGAAEEVAWSFLANHGGGYSWRLCKKGGNISEECFQQNVLRFHGNSSWIQYSDAMQNHAGPIKLPRIELPRVTVTEGTFPSGSEWARNPIPSCNYCDQSKCGTALPNVTERFQPHLGGTTDESWYYGGEAWFEQEKCAQDCSGFSMMQCPPGMTQFPEPLPGLSGYLGHYLVYANEPVSYTVGVEGALYSIVDLVEVPDVEAGDYLLSFRWDCEQSPQIWQSCADIRIVDGEFQI